MDSERKSSARKSKNNLTITNDRNDLSGFPKGLFIGSVLLATVAVLYAFRHGPALLRNIPEKDVPARLSASTRFEKVIEAGKPVNPGFGWRMLFYFASAVAMISDWRLKKI